MTKIIETERIILRKFNINDYKDVYGFNSNKEVQRFTGDKITESLNEAKELIENVWFDDYKMTDRTFESNVEKASQDNALIHLNYSTHHFLSLKVYIKSLKNVNREKVISEYYKRFVGHPDRAKYFASQSINNGNLREAGGPRDRSFDSGGRSPF